MFHFCTVEICLARQVVNTDQMFHSGIRLTVAFLLQYCAYSIVFEGKNNQVFSVSTQKFWVNVKLILLSCIISLLKMFEIVLFFFVQFSLSLVLVILPCGTPKCCCVYKPVPPCLFFLFIVILSFYSGVCYNTSYLLMYFLFHFNLCFL